MDGLLYISVALAVLVCGSGWRFVHQLKRKRVLSGIFWSVQGGLFLLLFILVLLVYSNLQTYQAVFHEMPVADVYLRQLGPAKYQLSLSNSAKDEDQNYFVLQGDYWKLDVKILQWTGWTNWLGLESYYQLDRISSYVDAAESRLAGSDYKVSKNHLRGLDIWRLKKMLNTRLDFVNIPCGRGLLMPMKNGAHFRVSIRRGGLKVEPVNEVARSSVL